MISSSNQDILDKEDIDKIEIMPQVPSAPQNVFEEEKVQHVDNNSEENSFKLNIESENVMV